MSNHPLVFNLRDVAEDEGVYIGRGSPWGNPFKIGEHGNRAQVIEKHRKWINGLLKAPNGERPPSKEQIRKHLRGRKLLCYCHPKRCHGNLLALIANASERKTPRWL